ncbi:hypothetical protein [uncultured Roseobacter sp.]|uniref:hypothetical protein n=1 Tax=uncultured Roseobacter sp. TaxID=114847 RepID=UPI0026212CF2|nr:hypothetical protein [uncultured Roseobacter sp.]
MLPRRGVYYTDLSYFDHFIGDQRPAMVAAQAIARRHTLRIKCLLLIFDFVHLPLSQLTTNTSTNSEDVISHLLGDPDVVEILGSGALTTSVADNLAIQAAQEKGSLFNWTSTSPEGQARIRQLLSSALAVSPDSKSQAETTLKSFTNSLNYFPASHEKNLRSTKDAIAKSSYRSGFEMHSEYFIDSVFDAEAFELFAGGYLGFLKDAYYQRSIANDAALYIYKRKVDLDEVYGRESVSFFFSPEWISQYFSEFFTKSEWAKVLNNKASALLAACESNELRVFQDFYHTVETERLQDNLFASVVASDETKLLDVSDGGGIDDFKEDLSNAGSLLSVTVEELADARATGPVVKLASRVPSIRRRLGSIGRPELRRAVDRLRKDLL